MWSKRTATIAGAGVLVMVNEIDNNYQFWTGLRYVFR